MAVSKKRKKVLFLVVALLIILIALFLFGVYMLRKNSEQIQGLIKNKVSSDVMKREAELSEVITEIRSQEIPRFVHNDRMKYEDMIPFKELGNDKITKVFKEFSLVLISNDLDNSEGGYVAFTISPDVTGVVWDGYTHGFYYSEEDSPIDIFTGDNVDCNTKVYYELMPSMPSMPSNKDWYRTEKITDNWWYYEAHFIWK